MPMNVYRQDNFNNYVLHAIYPESFLESDILGDQVMNRNIDSMRPCAQNYLQMDRKLGK